MATDLFGSSGIYDTGTGYGGSGPFKSRNTGPMGFMFPSRVGSANPAAQPPSVGTPGVPPPTPSAPVVPSTLALPAAENFSLNQAQPFSYGAPTMTLNPPKSAFAPVGAGSASPLTPQQPQKDQQQTNGAKLFAPSYGGGLAAGGPVRGARM